jgi:hypothetical protein
MKNIVRTAVFLHLFLMFSCASADYKPGDIYSVDTGESKFRAAKIIAIRGDTLLIHLYGASFDSRPGSGDLKNIDAFGNNAAMMPLTKGFFKEWEPELILNEPVTEEEQMTPR